LYFFIHSSWVRSSLPVEVLVGGAASSSVSSENFSVPVISSMDNVERSVKASKKRRGACTFLE
jgi:hypothetical protein